MDRRPPQTREHQKARMRSWLAVKPQPALRGKNMVTLQKPANDACCRSMWSAASEGAASNTGVTRASFLPQPDPLRLTVAAPEHNTGEHKQDDPAHSRLLHELTVPSSQSPTLRRHQGQGSLEHTPAWVLLGTGRYQVGSDGCSTHRMLLGNRTFPGWQRWMLAPSDASSKPRRYQVGSDGCSPHRMLSSSPTLPGWQRWMLAPSDASRKPRRYQVGSDGCSTHRMLLRVEDPSLPTCRSIRWVEHPSLPTCRSIRWVEHPSLPTG